MSDNKSIKNREAYIKDLRQQVEELAGGEVISMGEGSSSPEIEEKFLEYVLDYEQGDHPQLFDILTEAGLDLPHPDKLEDELLNKKLWELIHGLSLHGAFLYNTNHLSDRELYEELWYDILREECFIQPENPNGAYHIDLVGSGSEEDIYKYLKYYADDEERQSWLQDIPEDDMPEHVNAPYHRDGQLPRREDYGEA